MKLKLLAIAIVGIALTVAISSGGVRAQSAPAPTAGTKLVGGLLSPRGMKIGPDGMLYVAEAGTGGDMAVGTGDSASKSGLTGRISKIDPATGTRTTVADKLPSNAGSEGDAVGPADIAFMGTQLYYIQTHGGAVFGFPNNPTGVYKVNTQTGAVTLFADLGKFNTDTPSASIKGGAASDVEPGGNPYSLTVRNNNFYIVDGNQNSVVVVTAAGAISRLADFPTDITTTGITYNGTGPFYVSTLGGFPFAPADGRVYTVGDPTGALTQVASGFSSLTDVEFAPSGSLYAVTFGDPATDPNAPAPWDFGSGKILRVDAASGKFTPIVNGFTFSTSLVFQGDTLFVANHGVTIPGVLDGEIWKITNFSTIAPLPAPVPTTAPPPAATATSSAGTGGVITAPNTGSGGQAAGSGGNSYLTLILLGLAGSVVVAAGTRAIWRRDS